MTRKEIVKALRCFASEDYCPFDECNEKCPYWVEIDKYDIDNPNAEISDVHQLCYAAADLLEQDVPPTDMVPKDFHDRCMEMEIERRILLEQIHKKTVAEVCELRDQVRTLLAEKIGEGKTQAVKALLYKYDAGKLSGVKPEDYTALMDEARKL